MSEVKISDIFDKNYEKPSFGMALLLGKMCKGSGLKLTNDKLLYEKKLGISTHQSKVGHVTITDRLDILFKILELDPTPFHQGFKTEEDMFAYVASSPYMKSSACINLDKTYKQVFYDFRNYLLVNNIVTPGKNITKDHINNCVNFDFLAEVEKLDKKELRKRTAIDKFNGRTIMEAYPNLDVKRIPLLMRDFKFSFGDVETYRDFLLGNSKDDIIKKFESTVNI